MNGDIVIIIFVAFLSVR